VPGRAARDYEKARQTRYRHSKLHAALQDRQVSLGPNSVQRRTEAPLAGDKACIRVNQGIAASSENEAEMKHNKAVKPFACGSLGRSTLRTCSGMASPFLPEQALRAERRLPWR
jgi:hypothetical protein